MGKNDTSLQDFSFHINRAASDAYRQREEAEFDRDVLKAQPSSCDAEEGERCCHGGEGPRCFRLWCAVGDDERRQGKGVCPQEVQVESDFGVAGREPEEEDACACNDGQSEKGAIEDQHPFPHVREQGNERYGENE